MIRRLASAAVLVTALVGVVSCGEGGPTERAGTERFGIPIYPDALVLCEGHVQGAPGSGDILWIVVVTDEGVDEVVDFYARRLDAGSMSESENGAAWRLPPERPERIVTVAPAAERRFAPSCTEPVGSAETSIEISQLSGDPTAT